MTKEQRFFGALRDVFVGAKVDGESGYINLMRIKSRYYEKGIFPKLQQDINEALKPFPAFRDELFERLYDFFHRYFSESGSIYFRYTPLHQNVYEKVYTDDKDVMLFWKTHMLYYVKTDRLFRSLDVELDGTKFHFDVSTLEHKKANEKRDIVYSFEEKRKDTLWFGVAYSERGRKTNVDDMLRALRNLGVAINEETLERAFRVFEKQSEVDYFINKDAKAFLEEQFNLWLYQYVFSGVSEWTETRIKQLQTLKDIAFKIIAFIGQFENELVKIWNKPKFVLNSNYVITLDRIAEKNIGLVERVLAHKNFKAQVQEWQQLGMVDDSFKKGAVLEAEGKAKRLAKPCLYLPIDTKYFKDLELDILGLFDNLDQELDGWLIKSENYQALNTILRKFRERVKTIYIDPPYNTTASEIIYANNYKDSSWLSMIDNRLQVANSLLSEEGLLCVTIDDCEIHRLRTLLDGLSKLEIIGTVAIKNSPSGRPTVRGFRINHEYAVFMGRDKGVEIGQLDKSREQLALYKDTDEDGSFQWVNLRKRGGANTLRVARPKQYYPIYVLGDKIRIPAMKWNKEKNDWIILDNPLRDELVLYPIGDDGKERIWALGHDTARAQIANLKVKRAGDSIFVFRKLYLTTSGSLPSTWWQDSRYSTVEHGTGLLEDLLGVHQAFSFPKSVYAVEDCLRVGGAAEDESLVVDFFAGSGTTAHAVISLNRKDGGKRKYILVEVADYFDTVLLPRIKKVAFSDKWKGGRAQEGGKGVGHFVKCYCLEQYEDALRRARYAEADLFDDPNRDPYHQYVFLRDLKMLEALRVDARKNRVKVDLNTLYNGIDIAETLSNLTGKWVKRINADSVEFDDGEVVDTRNLDWRRIKPLIWW